MRKATALERFRAKVAEPDENGCMIWTAGKCHRGYGNFTMNGRLVKAHRAAYELLVGPIPPGLQLDHTCRVKACVNPKHLEPVTGSENMRRAGAAGALGTRYKLRTHCSKGHPYSEENTRVRQGERGTSRECRACGREYQAKLRAQRRR